MESLKNRLNESLGDTYEYGKNSRTGELKKDEVIVNGEIVFHLDANHMGFYGVSRVGDDVILNIKKDNFAKTAYKKYSDDVLKFIRLNESLSNDISPNDKLKSEMVEIFNKMLKLSGSDARKMVANLQYGFDRMKKEKGDVMLWTYDFVDDLPKEQLKLFKDMFEIVKVNTMAEYVQMLLKGKKLRPEDREFKSFVG